jgi:hypothetical protein
MFVTREFYFELFISLTDVYKMCFGSMQLGVNTVPVLVGPVSYLLLSKPAKDVEKSFSLLSLIDKILPVYK